MNELRPINVGIDGLGWPGERHAEAIAASPPGKVYAACEFAEQDRNFLRSITGEEPAVNSSSQAVELMKILDAVYRSSQIGAEVPIGDEEISRNRSPGIVRDPR